MRTQLQGGIKASFFCIPTNSPHFRKNLRSETQLSLYNVLRTSVHGIGSEMQMLRFQGKERTEASNVMFLRPVLPRYTEEQKENWAATRTPWNRKCDIKGQPVTKKLGCAESMTPKHLRLACQRSLIGQAKKEIRHFCWPRKGTMVQSFLW